MQAMRRHALSPPHSGALLLLLLTLSFSMGAAAPGPDYSVSNLPRSPETACNTLVVQGAFFACKLQGPTTTCCDALDAVYAVPESPSFGCLCYPPVLYVTVTKAALYQVDVLALLAKCRSTRGAAFLTQWASADPTTCPAMPLDANPVSLASLMGEGRYLPVGGDPSAAYDNDPAAAADTAAANGSSSRGSSSSSSAAERPSYAWSNLLQLGEVMAWKPHVYSIVDEALGIHLVQIMACTWLALPLLFLATHRALVACSGTYRTALAPSSRLVTCQHALRAGLFTLSLAPHTYLAVRVLFGAWTGQLVASHQFTLLVGLFVAPHAVLYLLEACMRCVLRWNLPLLLHHLVFLASAVIALLSRNVAVLGMGIVVDLCTTHDAPLYWALLAYRLRWPPRLARALLRAGCAWFATVRLFCAAVLVFLIIRFAAMPAVRTTPEFIIACVFVGVYAIVQLYTLVIYHGIDCALSRACNGGGGRQPLALHTALSRQPWWRCQASPASATCGDASWRSGSGAPASSKSAAHELVVDAGGGSTSPANSV